MASRPEQEEQEMKVEDDDIADNITLQTLPPPIQGEREHSGLVRDGSISTKAKPSSDSPSKLSSSVPSPGGIKFEKEETIGGDVTVKLEPGKALKLSRTTSQKITARPAQMFSHLPDATPEATSTFELLSQCHYAAKYLGSTEPALECDCTEEWDVATQTNDACGEDSDCINRATKMECLGDCGCGADCQNQRFQRKQYANVSVIKTEKKGYGLRTDRNLDANDFIFEYIGEVIAEGAFRRRMHQYDEEGIKHFYFMSLTKGEFVDATKRGNLGRFCNHSCNPNCYVDKWVVGDKLRMGIFAERRILAGEELVFNYNVDRYGADPQPCYCGEPNCTGYIGGKTQTERSTKLSQLYIEALGIDDGDGWDIAVAKKPRKKKTGEDDEEYVNNVVPKGLEEDGVTKVMATLAQCKEKWIAVKLLGRLQRAEDERVRSRVVKMHGYRMLNTTLLTFGDDVNVALQVFDILDKLPRLTRNKIQDSKIEDTVQKLTTSEDERVAVQAKSLLEVWSKLEIAFRIKKLKRDPNATAIDRRPDRVDRRESARDRSRSRSRSPVDASKGLAAPTGPKGNFPHRNFAAGPRQPFRPRPPQAGLPPGWFEAVAQNGSTYYYNSSGATTWQRPTLPALAAPPPPPPKVVTDQQILQNLIQDIVNRKETAKQQPVLTSTGATPAESTLKKVGREEKWRSYPEEKRKKLYENTLHPHISHVMNKYKNKLEKADLKRFGKDIAKQLVNSDFKHGRVEDPTKKLEPKQEKQVKEYVKKYFDKAVLKKKERDQRKKHDAPKKDTGSSTPVGSPPKVGEGSPIDASKDDVELSENEIEDEQDSKPTATAADIEQAAAILKRRREDEAEQATSDDSLSKKARTDDLPPPPPPPPPPPAMDDEKNGDEFMEIELVPTEDVPSSFHSESLQAMTNGSGNGTAMDIDSHVRQSVSVKGPSTNSPMQVATPPTTGSPDQGNDEREMKRREFGGLNPERMRALGLLDGASD